MASKNVEGRYQRRKWSAAQRIQHYSRSSLNGCVFFTGATDKDGYGKLRINNRDVRVHRVAWELAHGPIPDGLVVCHRCDTPGCINVEHLFLGTVADNNADTTNKGRRARGEGHGRARITEGLALEIFYAKGTWQEIADRYRIGRTTVGHIKHKETWRHVHAAIA